MVVVNEDRIKLQLQKITAGRSTQPLVKIGAIMQHVPAPVCRDYEVECQVEMLARLFDVPLPRLLIVTLDKGSEDTWHCIHDYEANYLSDNRSDYDLPEVGELGEGRLKVARLVLLSILVDYDCIVEIRHADQRQDRHRYWEKQCVLLLNTFWR